jgi:hypothetical protein
VHYVACKFEIIGADESFLALMEESGPFPRDLTGYLVRRYSVKGTTLRYHDLPQSFTKTLLKLKVGIIGSKAGTLFLRLDVFDLVDAGHEQTRGRFEDEH